MIEVFCCQCKEVVPAESIKGEELYGKFSRFAKETYFQCPFCKSYTPTDNHFKPVGILQNADLRQAVNFIKMLWDPLISQHKFPKTLLIQLLSTKMEIEIKNFVPETICTLEEARKYYRTILQIKKELKNAHF